jgi:hypothetical protein
MAFSLQAAGPILHWFTLVILCVLPVIGAIVLYKLGGLPGSIAAARGHPQAAAINVCGWMGLVTIVLWPLAMVWAHTSPHGASTGPATRSADQKALLDALRSATRRLDELEMDMSTRRGEVAKP